MSGQIAFWAVAAVAVIGLRAFAARRVSSRLQGSSRDAAGREEDLRAATGRGPLIGLAMFTVLFGAYACIGAARGDPTWSGWLLVALLFGLGSGVEVRQRARVIDRSGVPGLTAKQGAARRRIEVVGAVGAMCFVISMVVGAVAGRSGPTLAVQAVFLVLAFLAGGTAAWWTLVAGGPESRQGRAR